MGVISPSGVGTIMFCGMDASMEVRIQQSVSSRSQLLSGFECCRLHFVVESLAEKHLAENGQLHTLDYLFSERVSRSAAVS